MDIRCSSRTITVADGGSGDVGGVSKSLGRGEKIKLRILSTLVVGNGGGTELRKPLVGLIDCDTKSTQTENFGGIISAGIKTESRICTAIVGKRGEWKEADVVVDADLPCLSNSICTAVAFPCGFVPQENL